MNAIQVIKKNTYNNTTKWLDLQYHFVKDCIKQKDLELQHVPGKDNVADIFTKPLAASTFMELHASLLSYMLI